MTPKEKAEELYNKIYTLHSSIYPSTAIQGALVVVNEILSLQELDYAPDWWNSRVFWEEVKQEIQKL